MSLALTEEERMLKDVAHAFFQEKLPIKALRQLRDNHDPVGFDRAAWAAMAALGWAGILIPESHGGVGFGYKGLGQVLEESGRTLAASPLIATALIGAPLLLASASVAHKQTLLPAIAAGGCLLALAHDEQPRHRPSSIATRAETAGAGYVLNGAKTFVLDGHVADQLIVVARTSGAIDATVGISLFLMAATMPGITRTRTHLVDHRNAANVVFEDVALPADALLGVRDQGYATLTAVLDGARAGLAAEMLGSALEAFERTIAYLKLRKQFGVAIGSFQALKHRAAVMFCELELTRSAVMAALDAIDHGRADGAQLASLAKAKACDTFELISNEAVQLHGGIGMTDAEEIGFFLKRARVAQASFGDAGFQRARYADLMGL